MYVSDQICEAAFSHLEEEVSRDIRAACSNDFESFERLPAPQPGDYLYDHEEKGQTFNAYCRRLSSDNFTPTEQMHTFLIVPMGTDFRRSICAEWLEHLVSFCRAFFTGCEVEVLADAIPLDGVDHRENEFHHCQYRCSDLLDMLEGHEDVPHHPGLESVYCRLGVTLEDIYPNEDYNYAFGRGLFDRRVGIFSFARHSPDFGNGMHALESSTHLEAPAKMLWLSKCIHTMVHETCHILQMRHCVYYRCLMNGSSGHDDSAGRTMFLCPICLRKLLFALAGVSKASRPQVRYAEIVQSLLAMQQAICPASDYAEDASNDVAWLERRLKVLETKETAIAQREERREKAEAKAKAKAKGMAKTVPQDEQSGAGFASQCASSGRPTLEMPEPKDVKDVLMKLQKCTSDEFQMKHGIKGASRNQLVKKKGELLKIFADFLETASLDALHQYGGQSVAVARTQD